MVWRICFVGDHDLTKWKEFVWSIRTRFGNKNDVVEEFNKLVYRIDEHVEWFEELKLLISTLNPSRPQLNYISSFISGLKDDIKPTLKILKLDSFSTNILSSQMARRV